MKKTNNRHKILLVGGHFTAAIAVYHALKERDIADFYWAGHKYTMFKDAETSYEYKQIMALNIPFYDIKAGKLYRYFSFAGIRSFFRIPLGFVQAYMCLRKTRPDIVLSFGGYIAVPVSISAKLLGIPVVTHEQTVSIGLANKIVARIADKILLSWNLPLTELKDQSKCLITGNPVREDVFTHDHPLYNFQDTDKPTILILGGNQGSHVLNLAVETALPELLERYNIIHQCGSNTIYQDYERLEKKMDEHYRVYKGVWGADTGRAFAQADVVLTRSGANTVYELALLMKPSILIPLPFAVHNEQDKNARILESIGIGSIVAEKDISTAALLSALAKEVAVGKKLREDSTFSEEVIEKSEQMVKKDAAKTIADIVLAMLTRQQGTQDVSQ